MQYMSKIASQDQNILLPEEKDDEFLEQLEKWDWFKKEAQLSRGIRTLREVAHFVRSISLYPGFEDPETWSTPDVMLTMRQGQEHDHALLMASMFRACKYETHEELMTAFVLEQGKRNKTGGSTVIKILTKAGISKNMTEVANVVDESAAEDDEESESDGEKGDTDGDDSEEKAGSDDDDGDEDASFADASDVDIEVGDDDAGGAGAGGTGEVDDENETMEDRVFVCIGR